jgi:hypothetical protein
VKLPGVFVLSGQEDGKFGLDLNFQSIYCWNKTWNSAYIGGVTKGAF